MADFQAYFCNNRIVWTTLKFTIIWPYSRYIGLPPTDEFLHSAYRLKFFFKKSQINYLRMKENMFSYKNNQL